MGNILKLPGSGELQILGDVNDVSDGNHTFGELYNHRVLLYIALMLSHPEISWIATYHHDGTSFEGNFIAGMQLPTGQITYHIPMEFRSLFEGKPIKEYDFAPEWDGHTSDDVLARLEAWITDL